MHCTGKRHVHELGQHVLDILPVTHVAAGADHGVVAHSAQTVHVHEPCHGPVGGKRVRGKHHAVLVPEAEHRRASDNRLPVER